VAVLDISHARISMEELRSHLETMNVVREVEIKKIE
jgi:hypothetical protein